MPLPTGRRGAVLAAVALLVAASAAVAVVERRERRSLQARVERLEDERGREGAERPAPTRPRAADEDPESLFERLLGVLGGGGDAAGALGGSFLEDCSAALAGAGNGGPAGLFPERRPGAADRAGEVRGVAEAVEQIRALRFERVPDPVQLAPAELEQRVRTAVEEDLSPETTAHEGRVLVALGAVPPGTDLRALVLRALGRQVAGFYDPETGEMVVGGGGGAALDGQARTVLAHELEHALADQAFDLPVPDDAPPPGTEDEALARLSLVEGDATLTMQLYALRHVPLLEQLRGLGGALGAQADLAALPHHLQRGLTFPYLAGLSFVCRLHAEGGWPAVDRAYAAPPATTAQVLFHERYRSKEGAVDPRDAPSPGAGWQAGPRRALGAAELLWLLEAPGGRTDRALDDPLERVAAWAGGEVHAWARGGDTAAALVLAERPGARRLCDTVTAWYRAAFPDGVRAGPGDEALVADGPRQDAVVRCPPGEVRVGIGPDPATARAVAG